jgi:predicted TPR repeat methyltransferase
VTQDHSAVTLATYQAAARVYQERTNRDRPEIIDLVQKMIDVIGFGHVLEVGSGPGWDASLMESMGVQVDRTDGAQAFVDMMRSQGVSAKKLNVVVDDLAGVFDAVFANAVLLHLSRTELGFVMERLRAAVRPGGALAFTVKEGDGDGWSTAKLGLPRHFTYWRESSLRKVLNESGWTVVSLDHIGEGDEQPWLFVLARN